MNVTLSPAIRRALPAIVGSVLFAVALVVLRIELRQTSWHDLVHDLRSIPASQVMLAVLLTALNYIVLAGYDVLAFAYLGKRLPLRDVLRAAFIAYGVGNTVGGLALTGFSVRYRFYSRLGITIEELSRLAFSYMVTFWLGLLTLGGASLAFDPLPYARGLPAPGLFRAAGSLLLLIPLAYVVATGLRRTPLRVRRFELPLPSPRLALAQLPLSCLEWTLFAMILYALLPRSPLSFLSFLGAFLAATILGLASHVPGGVGVFEGLIVLLLHPFLSLPQLVPALVAFRAIYYLAPFAIALVMLVFGELGQPHSAIARAGSALNPLAQQLVPRVLSALGFCAGVVLLLSGAIPASPGRLRWLEQLFPLAVVETSHFLGSVAGAVLIVVSRDSRAGSMAPTTSR